MSENLQTNKKKRIILTIEERSTILRRLEAGELAVTLADEYQVTQSAISKIKKHRENILRAHNVLESCEGNVHKRKYRGKEDTELERKLYTWFKQQRAMGLSVSGPILKKKALFFHERLGNGNVFKASDGWLDLFKKRHGIKYLSVHGEKLSSDPRPSEEFKEKIMGVISATGISNLDHIYNCDETVLYWKLLPSKTVVFKNKRKAEDINKTEDQVTVMMCSNASGSHKIPLFVIGKTTYSHWISEINTLPVFYDHQENARMDRNLMMKWYSAVFVPEIIRQHDLENNLDTRIILIMDNAPCHLSAEELNAICASYTIVMYLPPNVISAVQPMNQGIIKEFKKYYRNCLLTRALTDGRGCENFLRLLNLLDCCNICALAWNEVTLATIRNSWKKIVPLKMEDDPVEAMEAVDITALHSLVTQIPELNGLSHEDIAEWVNVDSEELGWQPCSDEDILFGQSSNYNIVNVTEEWIDEAAQDQELTDIDPISQNNSITLQDALDASKTLIKWYETCEKIDMTTLHALLKANQMLIERKVLPL